MDQALGSVSRVIRAGPPLLTEWLRQLSIEDLTILALETSGVIKEKRQALLDSAEAAAKAMNEAGITIGVPMGSRWRLLDGPEYVGRIYEIGVVSPDAKTGVGMVALTRLDGKAYWSGILQPSEIVNNLLTPAQFQILADGNKFEAVA